MNLKLHTIDVNGRYSLRQYDSDEKLVHFLASWPSLRPDITGPHLVPRTSASLRLSQLPQSRQASAVVAGHWRLTWTGGQCRSGHASLQKTGRSSGPAVHWQDCHGGTQTCPDLAASSLCQCLRCFFCGDCCTASCPDSSLLG